LILLVLIFWEVGYRKQIAIEGVLDFCLYEDAVSSCAYVTTISGQKYLLSEGSLLKFEDAGLLAGSKLRLKGRVSRQTFKVKDLRELSRFQITDQELIQ